MEFDLLDDFIAEINQIRANGDNSRYVVDIGTTKYLIRKGDPSNGTQDVFLGAGDFRGLEHLKIQNVTFTSPTWIARFDSNTYAVRVIEDYIQNKAFANCKSLTSVLVPDTLNLIGSKAFSGCENLIAIHTRYLDGSVTNGLPPGIMLDKGAFYKSGLTHIVMPTGSVFVDGCFSCCKDLVSADISKCAMTFIPAYAFSECENLSNVKFQSDLQMINVAAFSSCKLERLELQSVVRVHKFAFQNNPLRTLTFGRNITSVGVKAFVNCQLLQVYLPRHTYIYKDDYGNSSFDEDVNIVRGNVFMQLPNLETPLRFN
jgi:hypothetical protein